MITDPAGLFHLKETCVLAAGLQTGAVRESTDKPEDKVADQPAGGKQAALRTVTDSAAAAACSLKPFPG